MNQKAQFDEGVSPIGFIMGIVGAILTWIMAGSMGSGFITRIIYTAIVGVVCYFLASFIVNRD